MKEIKVLKRILFCTDFSASADEAFGYACTIARASGGRIVALGLAQGRPLRDAVLLGLAAGAAAVMTPGSELCRREDTERLHRLILSGASTE